MARSCGAVSRLLATRALSSSPPGRAFTPATVFAVAEIGGKQYKVTVDDSVVTENMVGRRVGEQRS